MYLFIPLFLFFASLVFVFSIIFRKFGYLKKLSTDHFLMIENGVAKDFRGFLRQMFFEVFNYFERVNISKHKAGFLTESEKSLRKLRLFFLRMDNLFNSLISRVRDSSVRERASIDRINNLAVEDKNREDRVMVNNDPYSAENLKKEEHNMIIEIAKDPKNPELYKKIGTLYMRMGQWAYAKESFETALKLDPKLDGIKDKLEDSIKLLKSQTISLPDFK